MWEIKPHQASKIFKDGYGDCKDKSTLLSTMLGIAGIKSYPVLTSTRKTGRISREISLLACFNHMILAVEGKYDEMIWLDATAETCACGDLPARNRHRWVLVISPDFLATEEDTNRQGAARPIISIYQQPNDSSRQKPSNPSWSI